MFQLTNKKLIQKIFEQNQAKIKQYQEKIKQHNENVKIINTYNKLNISFELKENYNSIIPLNLYTCWHTKNLPPLMKQNYILLVENNPEFSHYLYDENDCREFIKNNFSIDVYNSYNKLIPCAYKADLWRYCVLYINGGVYVDIKFNCVNGFKFIALTEKENFVRDIPEKSVYNALIVTLPKNEILLKTINKIVENVKNNYYGFDPLYPTGPKLLANYFLQEEINNMELYHQFSVVENKLTEFYVVYNDSIIIKSYKNYREEQKKTQQKNHYDELWKKNKIYYG
jgi:mannosyltransferase OCH1-like enzyme